MKVNAMTGWLVGVIHGTVMVGSLWASKALDKGWSIVMAVCFILLLVGGVVALVVASDE